jgi:hypothetical protein
MKARKYTAVVLPNERHPLASDDEVWDVLRRHMKVDGSLSQVRVELAPPPPRAPDTRPFTTRYGAERTNRGQVRI